MGQSFRQYIESCLSEDGLHPDMVITVMPLIMEHESMKSNMGTRWNSQIDGYPQQIASMTYLLAKPIVFEWLKKHARQAWFLPVFAPGMEQCETDEEREQFIRNLKQQLEAE